MKNHGFGIIILCLCGIALISGLRAQTPLESIAWQERERDLNRKLEYKKVRLEIATKIYSAMCTRGWDMQDIRNVRDSLMLAEQLIKQNEGMK